MAFWEAPGVGLSAPRINGTIMGNIGHHFGLGSIRGLVAVTRPSLRSATAVFRQSNDPGATKISTAGTLVLRGNLLPLREDSQ